MSRGARLLLFGLVLLRVGLLGARVLGDPMRTWNLEESYNATVAWLLAHGAGWDSLLALQYRSFCGGCTVVAVAGAPLLGFADSFVAWKGLALLGGVAIHGLGFLAMDRRFGRAAAWAWALLFALPPPGMADLSLMLWGNHVESGVFAVVALLLLGGGGPRRAFALGLTLGFAAYFARSALYQWAVLPFALVELRGSRRWLLLGLALGAAPILLPAAGGDAGFYDLSRSLGAGPGVALERVGTLLGPAALADRLFHPLPDWTLGGLVWLVSAAVGFVRARGPLASMTAAWVVAYTFTTFPIFLVTPRVPVNNLRYHAPWALLLTLLVAAGAGLAWERRRALGALLLAGPLLASAAAWSLAFRPPRDWSALDLRASNPVELALMAAGRLDDDMAEGDRAAAALVRHMRGLRAGFSARNGADRDSLLRALPPEARLGFGEALVEPCADPEPLDAWLTGLTPEDGRAVGRGAGLTLGLCHGGEGEGRRRRNRRAEGPKLDVEALLARPTRLASAAGGAFLMGCERESGGDGEAIGRCLGRAAAGNADILWGAGVSYAHPMRTPAEREAIAAGIGADGGHFREGTRELVAGVFAPYAGR